MRRLLCTLCVFIGLMISGGAYALDAQSQSANNTQLTTPPASKLDLSLPGRDTFTLDTKLFADAGYSRGTRDPLHSNSSTESTDMPDFGNLKLFSGNDVSLLFSPTVNGEIKLGGDVDGEVRLRFYYDKPVLFNCKFELELQRTEDSDFLAIAAISRHW